jgi:hypothetical protein
MPIEQVIGAQETSAGRDQDDGSGKPICALCQVVMSRRFIGKPDDETGLCEVTYRCPACGATVNRRMKD